MQISTKSPMRIALLCAGLISCTHQITAQDARVVGKVIDLDGEPVEGAEVVLRSHGWRFRPELGEVHEVRAKTRKNGRFRAKIFGGRRYSAWARLPEKATRFTEIQEEVRAGRPLTLRAETFRRRAISIRPLRLDAWKKFGPFRFRCSSGAQNFTQTYLEPGEDGSIDLPDSPGKQCHLEIIDARGEAFAVRTCSYVDPTPASKPANADVSAWLTSRLRTVAPWEVPKPFRVRIRVEAFEEKGQALAGVEFRWTIGTTHTKTESLLGEESRELSRSVGTTGLGGKLVAEIPVGRRFGSMTAEARDRVLTSVSLRPSTKKKSKSFSKAETAEDGTLDIVVRMKKGTIVKGRVVDAEGKGLAGLRLTYPRLAANWFEATRARWQTLSPRLVRTDSEGRFRFDPLMPGRKATITALPSRAQLARLAPGIAENQSVPRSIVLTTQTTNDRKASTDLGDLGAKMRSITVTVERHGQPASFARLMVIKAGHAFGDNALGYAACDRRGRTKLLVSDQAGKILAWEKSTGYVIRDLKEDPIHGDEDSLKLALVDFRWVSGSVLDADGNPIAGASLSVASTSTRGITRQFVKSVNNAMRSRSTDAGGKFRFPFIPEPNWSVELRASVRRGGRSIYSTGEIECPALNADLSDLELTIEIPPMAQPKKN